MDEIKVLSELYSEAEVVLKDIERRIHEGLVVPSINELRYAGYHLLQALNSDDDDVRKDQITKAENHAKRAIYDAVEVGVLDKLESVDRFKRDYRLINVCDVIPDYVEKLNHVKSAQKFIKKYNMHERADHYKECIQQFDVLDEIVDTFELARSELNKQMLSRRKAALATGIMIAIGLVGLSFQYYTYSNKQNGVEAAANPVVEHQQKSKDVLENKPNSSH